MMMPRKKRRILIIASVIFLILILIAILIALYLTTDMFKSNSTLFAKYMGQNVENMKNIYSEIGKSEYKELIKENKYESETKIKVNQTKNIGTTIESTENPINQLILKIDGQTDLSNNYNYQDIKLMRSEEQISEIECIKDGNTFGLKFPNTSSQYVLTDNENLKELLEAQEYSEEQISNILDIIENDNKFNNIFELSEEEKESIKSKYVEIILDGTTSDNFSKQANQTIEIGGKNIETNSYILSLTKEQINNMYISILEELKQDEIILSKIEKFQETLNQYLGFFDKTENLKDKFSEKIQDIIDNIVQNNIGKEEYKIIVYESNGTTVKTVIQGFEYEININLLSTEGLDKYIEISYKDIEKETEKIYRYEKTSEQTNFTIQNIKNEETSEYSIVIDEKINENTCQRNIVAKYEDMTNRVEINIENTVQIVQNLKEQVELSSKNSINLGQIQQELAKNILESLRLEILGEIKRIEIEVINTQDLINVLISANLMQEEQSIEGLGVTETERNRYNSRFEILQGNDIDAMNMLNVINAIKENLVNLKVISATELRLELDRNNNNNEESFTILSNFIEKNKSNKYNVQVEYDEKTRLVNGILIKILETK